MNIAEAGIKIKRLSKRILDKEMSILLYNSLGTKNPESDEPQDVEAMFEERKKLSEEFVQLTSCLIRACEPLIESDIRQMELEAELAFLRRCKTGAVLSPSLKSRPIINVDQIEEMIVKTEKELDNLEKEILNFKQETEIEQLSVEKTT